MRDGGMKSEAPLQKKDHWRLVAVMVAVQLLDVAVTNKLCSSGELNAAGVAVVQTFHYGSNFLLLLLLVFWLNQCKLGLQLVYLDRRMGHFPGVVHILK